MSGETTETGKSWEVMMSRLSQEILAGVYRPEEPLPGEYALCERFSCSRTTVRRAMVELEKKGLIYRRQGKGTFAHPVMKLNLPPMGLLVRKPERLTGDYFVELIRGCNSYLNTVGSQLTIISQQPQEWQKRLFETVCGVIIVPVSVGREDIACLSENNCQHVVMMESLLPGQHVNMELEKVSYDLAKMLLDKGHRRIALISGHGEHSDFFKRNGISRALSEYGIAIESVRDIHTDYDIANARQAAQMLVNLADRPTAIIGFDDMIAVEVMNAAQNAGLKVPQDLSVVGFNDSPMSSLVTPELTTVHFPVHDAGRAAARMLAMQYLKGVKAQTIVQQPHIVSRGSVALYQ